MFVRDNGDGGNPLHHIQSERPIDDGLRIDIESSVAALDLHPRSPLEVLGDRWQSRKDNHRAIWHTVGSIVREDWQDTKADFSNAQEIIGADYTKGKRIRTSASAALLVGAQAVGALRLPLLMAPVVAEHIGDSHNPIVAAATTAAAFSTWNYAAGQILDDAMNQHPNTVRATNSRLSSLVKFFSPKLPGLEQSTDKDQKRHITTKGIGSFAVRNLRRGIATVGIGMGPYVAIANLKGESDSDRRKLRAKCAIGSGVIIGTTSGIFAEANIKPLYWFGATGALIVGQSLANRRKSKKA